VVCIPILRWKQPDLPRPIKVNLFFPIIYIICTIIIVVVPMFADPVTTGITMSHIILGLHRHIGFYNSKIMKANFYGYLSFETIHQHVMNDDTKLSCIIFLLSRRIRTSGNFECCSSLPSVHCVEEQAQVHSKCVR
jgi:amino acid transporter